MPRKHHFATALLTLLCAGPGALQAVNFGFLEQAPVRFLSDADTALLGDTIIRVLNESADGESKTWQGEQSGDSGTVTAVSSFENDGRECRRVQIDTRAAKATRGGATSLMDLCKVGEEWRILRVPQ
jgi:surface antigen